MSDLDAQVRVLLGRAVDDVRAPLTLTDGVLTSGRRLRSRRRQRRAGGVVALLMLVAAVFALWTGAPDGRDVGRDSAGDSQTQATYQPPRGWWDAPSRELARRLAPALPPGVTIGSERLDASVAAPGAEPDTHGYIGAQLHSSRGDGTLEVFLAWPPPTADDLAAQGLADDEPGEPPLRRQIRCPENTPRGPRCRQIRSDDGEIVGMVSTFTSGRARAIEAKLIGPRGGVVSLDVSNSLDFDAAKDRGNAGPTPLGFAQVVRLIQNPVWTSGR